ncbi:MAG TPA: PLP-dependent aminotransferase family protein [Candidatus Limnocylindrales bacterium]|nr:PLP-dependent aminotransferase family protein [Candidatus Limnocylindrales bacterium]
MREPVTTIHTKPIGRRLADAVDTHISLVGRRDLSGEIYRQLRSAILEGRLVDGDRLPPTRELARRLGVSRTTATVAYDRLIGEGFATARAGSGTFVDHAGVEPRRRRPRRTRVRPQPAWEAFPLPSFVWDTTDAEFDFRLGVIDAGLFPYRTWRRLMARQFQPAVVGRGVNEHPAGLAQLRGAIAHHVGLARGIRATADDIIVTNGAQQATDLIGRVLLRPGDRVAVEDPGYGPPFLLLRAMGARVSCVPVDREGLVVDAIPAGTRLVCVTPAHQLPLGMTMSQSRRLALLAWARQANGVIVEDDYDSEFRFGGRPIEPLHTLDDDGRVIYVGSFSKTTLPTIRLGFMVAPPSLRQALWGARLLTDWHSPIPLQGAMAEFIAEGHFARHVRRMRLVYEARHELVTEILNRRFSSDFRVVPSAAGLHVSATAVSMSTDQVQAGIREAARSGVQCYPLGLFALTPPAPAGLVLGYGAIPTERIEAGLERLRRAMAGAR